MRRKHTGCTINAETPAKPGDNFVHRWPAERLCTQPARVVIVYFNSTFDCKVASERNNNTLELPESIVLVLNIVNCRTFTCVQPTHGTTVSNKWIPLNSFLETRSNNKVMQQSFYGSLPSFVPSVHAYNVTFLDESLQGSEEDISSQKCSADYDTGPPTNETFSFQSNEYNTKVVTIMTQPPHMVHVLLFPPTFQLHFHPLKPLQSTCVIYRWSCLSVLYTMVVSELQNSNLDSTLPFLQLAILL
jgi:hypothetical protein